MLIESVLLEQDQNDLLANKHAQYQQTLHNYQKHVYLYLKVNLTAKIFLSSVLHTILNTDHEILHRQHLVCCLCKISNIKKTLIINSLNKNEFVFGVFIYILHIEKNIRNKYIQSFNSIFTNFSIFISNEMQNITNCYIELSKKLFLILKRLYGSRSTFFCLLLQLFIPLVPYLV